MPLPTHHECDLLPACEWVLGVGCVCVCVLCDVMFSLIDFLLATIIITKMFCELCDG